MTTPLDRRLVPAARKLIDKFGATCTLRSVTKGTYDDHTGGYVGGSKTDHEVKGSPPSPIPIGYVGLKVGDEVTTLTSDDVISYLAGETVPEVPKRGDFFAIGEPPASTDDDLPEPAFAVLIVGPIYSGDQVAVYELVMRP